MDKVERRQFLVLTARALGPTDPVKAAKLMQAAASLVSSKTNPGLKVQLSREAAKYACRAGNA